MTPNAFDYHLTNVIVFRCKNLTISKSKILQKKMNNAISRSPISNKKILLPPLVIFSTGWPISINLQVLFLFSVYGVFYVIFFNSYSFAHPPAQTARHGISKFCFRSLKIKCAKNPPSFWCPCTRIYFATPTNFWRLLTQNIHTWKIWNSF